MLDSILSKLVEMTLDGRLTLVWIFVAFVVVVAIYELVPWFIAYRKHRARRIYLAKHYGLLAKYLK